ncbi:transmembrane and coiled-coil domain-containing protein 4-like [Glandiceps talaboti]
MANRSLGSQNQDVLMSTVLGGNSSEDLQDDEDIYGPSAPFVTSEDKHYSIDTQSVDSDTGNPTEISDEIKEASGADVKELEEETTVIEKEGQAPQTLSDGDRIQQKKDEDSNKVDMEKRESVNEQDERFDKNYVQLTARGDEDKTEQVPHPGELNQVETDREEVVETDQEKVLKSLDTVDQEKDNPTPEIPEQGNHIEDLNMPEGNTGERTVMSNEEGKKAVAMEAEEKAKTDNDNDDDDDDDNDNDDEDKQTKRPLLPERLSDPARFAYASIFAVSLGLLFENDYDSDWRKKTMRSVLDHLKLGYDSETFMESLMAGIGAESLSSYLETLTSDPVLREQSSLLPEDLVRLAIREGLYDARMRVLIFHVALYLNVPREELEKQEENLAELVKKHVESEEMEEEIKQRENEEYREKVKKYALLGVATVGSGAAIGLTAGLATPWIAAGMGIIIKTAAGAAAVKSAAAGAAGAGITAYRWNKGGEKVQDFEFNTLTEGSHLHVAIAISGWLTNDKLDNFHDPWSTIAISKEQYYLKWECKHLTDLGNAVEKLFSDDNIEEIGEEFESMELSGK